MKREVLIDATCLGAASGKRGIGRYVRDLLLGLASVGDTEAPDLRFGVITAIHPTRLEVSFDLRAAVEASVGVQHPHPHRLPRMRRYFLGPAAAARKASLLHVAEVLGRPLVHPLPLVGTCYDLIPLRYPRHYLGATVLAERFPLWSPKWRTRRIREEHRYRGFDRVVCISERTRRDLLEVLDLEAENVDVVQTGVELSRYADTRDASDGASRSARPFVLYVGHSDWRKNVETMFQTVVRVNQTRALDFVWAGNLPPKDLAAMQRLAKKCGAESYVKFLGFVSDERLTPLYHDAAALLFLSRLEGFGLPVLEAMAAGCPAIVSRDSAADEVVGDAGFVVAPDGVEEAAGRLVQLLDQPALRRELGEKGVARSALFNAPDMARGYITSYRHAMTQWNERHGK